MRLAWLSYTSFQPLRYSRRMNASASGQPFAFIVAASHSSFLPARYATLPRWFASVSQPAYSKLHVVGAPVLQAWIHSA